MSSNNQDSMLFVLAVIGYVALIVGVAWGAWHFVGWVLP